MGGKKRVPKRKQKSGSFSFQSPPSNSRPQEDGDIGTHDVKEDVTDDIIRHTSQEDNQDQLIGEFKDSSCSVGLSESDKKPMLGGSENGENENLYNKTTANDVIETIMEVLRELETDETIGSAKESGTSSSSSSSDSSSDEESQKVDKTQSSVMEEAEKSKDGDQNSDSVDEEVVLNSDSNSEIVPPVDQYEKIVSLVEDVKSQVVLVTKVEKIEDSSSIDSPTYEKIVLQSGVRYVETSDGGETPKEPETPESLQKKQEEQLAIIPQVVRLSSWKSCCGLLELFNKI